jgi:hypothetical protein
MRGIMRQWLAARLHPDRRWSTLGATLIWIGFTFIISTSLWQLVFYRGLPVPTGVLLEKTRQARDPAEQQNFLVQLNAANARNGAELARRAKLNSLFTRLGIGAIAISVIPMFIDIARKRRRAGWRTRGCCIECGYNLCESPERCPECGTASGLAGGE